MTYLITKSFTSYIISEDDISYTFFPMGVRNTLTEAIKKVKELISIGKYCSESVTHINGHYTFSIFIIDDNDKTIGFLSVPVYGLEILKFGSESSVNTYYKVLRINDMSDEEFVTEFNSNLPETYEECV